MKSRPRVCSGRRAHSRQPSLSGVDDPISVLTAVLLALLVLVAGVLAFRLSERAQREMPELPVDEIELDSDMVGLLSAINAASIVLGPDDEILRASPTAHSLGLLRNGRIAHAQLTQLVTETRREGGSREVQYTLPRGPVPGSSRISVFVQVAALRANRVLVLAEDQTAAKRLEDVRRDFVANVSHELKTPVGAISLLAETIAEAADDPEAVLRFAERMGIESRRLSGLVQDIIDLSRLQDANLLLASHEVNLDDVVTEAVDRCRIEAEARDIAIVVGPASGVQVFGDSALLMTAVRNLLDNAIRYSTGGTRVAVAVRKADDGLAEVTVVDQGIGIDPEALPRVFERFYRVDAARSRSTGGTGLGLSIVKHVAADHGGEVSVWSTPGRGSTFTLRRPTSDYRSQPSAPAALSPLERPQQ